MHDMLVLNTHVTTCDWLTTVAMYDGMSYAFSYRFMLIFSFGLLFLYFGMGRKVRSQ